MTAIMPDLFAYAKSRTSDPQTSRDAAKTVNTTALEAAVYGAIKVRGPSTSFEIANQLRLSVITVSPRLRPLADKGLVRDSGERRVNESGRKSIVWELVK